jgi:cyanate lyase
MLTNPNDQKRLVGAMKELSNSMTRVEAEKDFQKEAIDSVAEELNLEKKYIRKLATIYHKQNMTQFKQENEEVETLYEILVNAGQGIQE